MGMESASFLGLDRSVQSTPTGVYDPPVLTPAVWEQIVAAVRYDEEHFEYLPVWLHHPDDVLDGYFTYRKIRKERS